MASRVSSIHSSRYRALIRTLVKFRKEAGLSQSQLALWLGIEQPDVSKIESCERRLDAHELLLWLEHTSPQVARKIIEELGLVESDGL